MANASVTLTRTAYAEVANDGDTVSVSLPEIPYRKGLFDRVELIASSTAITGNDIPDVGVPHEDAIVLENAPEQFAVITNYTVLSGEKLYGRWLGQHDYDAATDLRVITF